MTGLLRTLTIHVDGVPVKLTYDAAAVGRGHADAAPAFRRDGECAASISLIARAHSNGWLRRSEATVHALAAVLVSWNVENDDGSPFAPTAENLIQLPIPLLGRLVNAIDADILDVP